MPNALGARILLLRGYDTLSAHGKARLQMVSGRHDATDGLPAGWGITEQLRRILTTSPVEAARHQMTILGCYLLVAEWTTGGGLWHIVDSWWAAIDGVGQREARRSHRTMITAPYESVEHRANRMSVKIDEEVLCRCPATGF